MAADAAGAAGGRREAELRARLQRVEPAPPPYRTLSGVDVPWEQSPAASDVSLRRFLAARKGDLARAEAMFVAHLGWRRRVFPIAETRSVTDILTDGRRLWYMGQNKEGVPILVMNFLWGYFLEGTTALDCLRATLLFMEREIARAEQQGLHQAIVVCYGGPPPLDFAGALAATLEANYPERLLRAAVYPVPHVLARFVSSFMWILDQDTAQKVKVHSDEDAFLSFLALGPDQLPVMLRGGIPGAERQFSADSRARMGRLLRAGIYGGAGPARAIQAELLRPLEDVVASATAVTPAPDTPRNWLCCCTGREPAPPEERPKRGPAEGARKAAGLAEAAMAPAAGAAMARWGKGRALSADPLAAAFVLAVALLLLRCCLGSELVGA